MKFTRKLAMSFIVFASVAAMAASPNWQSGVVREVGNHFERVEVAETNGDTGLAAGGAQTQFCTVQVGQQLLIAEREIRPMDHSHFVLSEDRPVELQLVGDTMTLKDKKGNKRTFHVLKTLPDTPANEPDHTAFAERPIVVQ